jgi:streptogramin lyase
LTTVPTTPATAGPSATAPPSVPAPQAEQQRLASLGVPLRDVLLIGGAVAPGPNGTPVLWSVSSGAPAHLNAVDPATGTAIARYDLPGAGGSYAIDSAPDGSVYVGTYNDGRLFRWTATGGVVDLGRPLASEHFIWDVKVAADGTVFGGTFGNGKLFSYSPATGQVRDYGRVHPSQAYGRTVALSGDKVYVGSEAPGHLMEVDIASGAKREIPQPAGLDPATSWVYDLDAVDGYLYARYGGATPAPLFVYDIAAGQWSDRLDSAHGLEVSPADAQGNVYLLKSGGLVRYNPVTKAVTTTEMTVTGRIGNTRGIGWAELGLPDYPGRSIVGLLWRGLMFRYNPTTGAHSYVQTTIQGEPIEITAISDGPDGREYVGGYLNGGFAAIDPQSGVTTEFHTFGQSEAMTRHGDKLYVGVYPDARLYSYDPTKPWNSLEYSPSPEPSPVGNPQLLFTMKPELQIRNRGMVSAGPYVAVGTMPEINLLGGYLVIYDPATGQAVTKERNVSQDQSIVALAYNDGIVYGATSIYGGQSATVPTTTEGKVFAWSIAEKRKLWELVPVPGKPVVSGLTIDDTGRLWGTEANEVFSIDVRTAQVTTRWSYGTGTPIVGDVEFNPVDRMLYATVGGMSFSRIDPVTGQRFVIHDQTSRHIDVHPNGDVYVNSGSGLTELFRYDLPAGPCKHPDPSATVTIRDADSGVPNRSVVGGCTIDDLFHDEARWSDGTALVRYTTLVANLLKVTGAVTANERDRIVAASKRATI